MRNIATWALLFVLAAYIALFPAQAFADYSNPNINTVAQVRTDGSLHVVEQRTYSFDETYDILTWRISGLPSDADVEVSSVRMANMTEEGMLADESGDEQPIASDAWMSLEEESFKSPWRDVFGQTEGIASKVTDFYKAQPQDSEEAISPLPESSIWAFDKRQNTIYVFGDFSGNLIIECDYIASNAMFVYDDIAELYWDYVPQTDDSVIENVDVSVQLPVPENMPVAPGDNIRGWGHGPEGEVTVSADGTIDFFVPKVEKGQYAQAHIIFPSSWLTNLPREMKLANSGLRKDSAVAEEREWTDTWSNKQINDITLRLVMIAICIASIVAALIVYSIYGRPNRKNAARNETAYSTGSAAPDVFAALTEYSSVIIGRLMRWNMSLESDLVAPIMSLHQKGIIEASDSDEFENIYFRISKKAKSERDRISDIERQALSLWFDRIGEEYETVGMKSVAFFAKSHANEFLEATDEWNRMLKSATEAENFVDLKTKKAQKALAILAVALLVLGVLSISVINWWSVICFASALAVGVLANYTRRYTEKGTTLAKQVELLKTEALNGEVKADDTADSADTDTSADSAAAADTAQHRDADNHNSRTDRISDALAPYIFEATTEEELELYYSSIPNPSSFERFWLSPRKDKYGRSLPCVAWAMVGLLDEAIKQAEK